MDSGEGQSSEYKTKSPLDPKVVRFKVPFRAFWHKVGFEESLKLAKPDEPTWDKTLVLKKDYPKIFTKMVDAGNQHAFYIMHNLNHKNVMCMRALGSSKPKGGDELSAFFLECNGDIYQDRVLSVYATTDGFIPSQTFQDIISEIIDGADFLWRNETYHGNLSWATTHFERPYTVKLYGFTPKDQISLGEAQWQDWDSIVAMLEEVVAEATRSNACPGPKAVVYAYDELQTLIDTMKASARENANPLLMRARISEVLFWNARRRAQFCMTTIHNLFNNQEFEAEVEISGICPEEWYSNTRIQNDTENLTDFERLVKYCNNYRQNLAHPLPIFAHDSRMGFLHFLHAAYTHRSQIMAFMLLLLLLLFLE